MNRAALAALTLCCLVPLVACDDDPEPDIAPPDTSSAAPTEPTTEPPTTPPVKLSPEETVRAWVEARNDALATGDFGDMQALSATECSSCAEQVKGIKRVYDAGGSFKTRGWRVQAASVESESATRARISTALVLAGGTTIPSEGAEPIQYQQEKRIALFDLGRRNGQWLLTLIGFVR